MARWLLIWCVLGVTSCASLDIIDVASRNQNSRINFLVLHFTSENFAKSLRLLTQHSNRPVSVHYLVPEPDDETYQNRTLKVHRLVAEDRAAWHAGQSSWAGASALNGTSIGIEIVNQSACVDSYPDTAISSPAEQSCNFLDYPYEQIDLIMALATDILARNPDIDPADIIGHGDIAPTRRVDPGPAFPWKRLYDHGIGAWYDDDAVTRYKKMIGPTALALATLQRALKAYGYQIEETNENDAQTQFVIRAFQMHFRPSDFSGKIDVESAAILFALIEKYRSESLGELLRDADIRLPQMEPG